MTATMSLSAARVVEAVRASAHTGPVWFPDEKTLYFTSAPTCGENGRVRVNVNAVRLDGCPLPELTGPVGIGRVRTVLHDANAAHGMCADITGSLLVCEKGGPGSPAGVSRLDRHTGIRHMMVAAFAGRSLNSPNEVAVHPDGSIWFTDSPGVHRFDPRSGEHTLVAAAVDNPSGLAFAPDGRTMYVGHGSARHEDGVHGIRPHAVTALRIDGGRVVDRPWIHHVRFGYPGGLKTDRAGRVWFTTGDGLRLLSPDGEHLADIPLAGAVNFAFVESDDVVLVTADTAIWAVVLDFPL